jgi:hypothetical protein
MVESNEALAQHLVDVCVASHQRLAEFLGSDLADESRTLDWVDAIVTTIAKDTYDQFPHWHHWTGKCIGEVPFEHYIWSLGLFGTIWYYDIMLRKARDRKAPTAAERTEAQRHLLMRAMDLAKQQIDSSQDLAAEEGFKRDGRPPNKLRHYLNRLMWGH